MPMMRVGGLWLVLLGCVMLPLEITAHPASFTRADKEDLLRIVKRISPHHSLEEIYYATEALTALGETPENLQDMCSAAQQGVAAPRVVARHAFHSLSVQAALGCANPVKLGLAQLLVEELDASTSLSGMYYAIGALAHLKEKVSGDVIGRALMAVKELMDDDGSFRFQEDDVASSAGAAGMVFEMLANAMTLGPMSNVGSAAAAEIQDTISNLFGLAEEVGDDMLAFDGDDADGDNANLAATARVLVGSLRLARAAEGLLLPAPKVRDLAAFVLHAPAINARDAFHVATSLQALNAPAPTRPLAVTALNKFVSAKPGQAFKLSVTTIMGNPAPPCRVTVLPSDGPMTLVSIPTDLLEQNGEHVLHLEEPLEMGMYTFAVKVAPADLLVAAASRSTHSLLVRGPVTVSGIAVAIHSSASLRTTSSPLASTTVSLPGGRASHLTLDALERPQHLRLALSLSTASMQPFQANQVMLRVTPPVGDTSAYFVGEMMDIGTYIFTVTCLQLEDQLGGVSAGTYRYALMLGDKLMENSQITEIGNLTVRPPSNMEPIPQVVNKFAKLPDISPTPRAKDEPPPTWVSLLFTLLALMPLVLLFVMLGQLGANLRSFPKESPAVVFNLGLHLGIASILGLLVFYWLKLNILQMLPFLGGLCLFTCMTGYPALSFLVASKEKHA